MKDGSSINEIDLFLLIFRLIQFFKMFDFRFKSIIKIGMIRTINPFYEKEFFASIVDCAPLRHKRSSRLLLFVLAEGDPITLDILCYQFLYII